MIRSVVADFRRSLALLRRFLTLVHAQLFAVATLSLLCVAPRAVVSAQETAGPSFPLGVHVGIPQGEFAENVAIAGGLGGGALGLIDVDVNTTNAILGANIGLQLGVPGPFPRPYVGALIGFSAFTTSSSVSGSNSADEAFASSTNSSDAAFARTAIAGFYIPVGSRGTVIDLGARYNWNGEEVEYLTPGDITEDINGAIVLNPRRTRADLLTVVIGVSMRPRRMMSK